MNVIETDALGKRYRHTWALMDCSLRIPAGRVIALVGPNGAGKTTLLHLLVGLTLPTGGHISLFQEEGAGSPSALEKVAFVAQDAPLYRYLSVDDSLHLARNLNQHWDDQLAHSRLAELEIPLGKKVGRLSGGQQAQVALTLAVARRPELLVLDEPMTRLDPLARHEFTAQLMTQVAENGTSVILSSHVVTELERVADYLVLLSKGRLELAGDIDELLSGHFVLTGPANSERDLATDFQTVHAVRGGTQTHVLVRARKLGLVDTPPGWQSDGVGLEELVLAYLRRNSGVPSGSSPTLSTARRLAASA